MKEKIIVGALSFIFSMIGFGISYFFAWLWQRFDLFTSVDTLLLAVVFHIIDQGVEKFERLYDETE